MGSLLGRAKFLMGIDANYVLVMKNLGLSWYVGERKIEPYKFFADEGINFARIRLWVGEEGPSRLNYAIKTAKIAQDAGMDLCLVLFLSDRWADLTKQPAPEMWTNLNLAQKGEAIENYAKGVAERFEDENLKVDMYAVGNEIDYGLCGTFEHNKKSRKRIEWLRKRIWCKIADFIRAGTSGIKAVRPDANIMVHIAKWWKPDFAKAFFQTMKDLDLRFECIGLSYYPTMIGNPACNIFAQTLEVLSEVSTSPICIAEYGYPSSTPKGQIWYMNKQLSEYPFTPEGQKEWIVDFLSYCHKHPRIIGAFYWSPEMYLEPSSAKAFPKATGCACNMPLNFGWAPMALFNGEGQAKIGANAFSY